MPKFFFRGHVGGIVGIQENELRLALADVGIVEYRPAQQVKTGGRHRHGDLVVLPGGVGVRLLVETHGVLDGSVRAALGGDAQRHVLHAALFGRPADLGDGGFGEFDGHQLLSSFRV